MRPRISVIIPARNEAALIGSTMEAAIKAADAVHRASCAHVPPVEIIVVDNASDDRTVAVVTRYAADPRVQLVHCARRGAAAARNAGVARAAGELFIFLDADTLLPPTALCQIVGHWTAGALAGITRLAAQENAWRARLWWWFWTQVRRLPLARAKAMPALMFCTRRAFEHFGPFDETVSIGEEWPILAGVYRARPEQFVYDRTIVARSSSRRMTFQPFGYTRTFARYLWAVLHHSGRIDYPDTVRNPSSE